MKKLFLRSFLTGEEMNIVDQQHIRLAITFPELDQSIVLNGVNDLIREPLAGEVHDFEVLLPVCYLLTNRLHQVRLAETHSSIYEQRIVSLRGGLGDRQRGRMRKLVVRANHKRIKRIARIHPMDGGRLGILIRQSYYLNPDFGTLFRLRQYRPGRLLSHAELDLSLAAQHLHRRSL